ncbi:hypothetical protein COLO4_20612 [Corchorus olitorius]|uniref:Uncharacterized protein n=1 Tax=Corchorus olitorius TaxID=93759 RepID=A0A1R3IYP0_9ROSI|nr:hypothetical protein COLO4_20612 [Corchorus olitorius]
MGSSWKRRKKVATEIGSQLDEKEKVVERGGWEWRLSFDGRQLKRREGELYLEMREKPAQQRAQFPSRASTNFSCKTDKITRNATAKKDQEQTKNKG